MCYTAPKSYMILWSTYESRNIIAERCNNYLSYNETVSDVKTTAASSKNH